MCVCARMRASVCQHGCSEQKKKNPVSGSQRSRLDQICVLLLADKPRPFLPLLLLLLQQLQHQRHQSASQLVRHCRSHSLSSARTLQKSDPSVSRTSFAWWGSAASKSLRRHLRVLAHRWFGRRFLTGRAPVAKVLSELVDRMSWLNQLKQYPKSELGQYFGYKS